MIFAPQISNSMELETRFLPFMLIYILLQSQIVDFFENTHDFSSTILTNLLKLPSVECFN